MLEGGRELTTEFTLEFLPGPIEVSLRFMKRKKNDYINLLIYRLLSLLNLRIQSLLMRPSELT